MLDVALLRAPHIVDGGHQAEELRLGKIGATVERLARRREKHRHRPTAAPGEGLHGVHIDRIDVGTLLAVDLDIDEETVHLGRDLKILEALVSHHVAPMTSRVSHAQQDRNVALNRGCKCVGSPSEPIDGIVSVLAQVGAGLLAKTIHELGAHSMKASVDMDDLAGRSRKPVAEQYDHGLGHRTRVKDIPSER